MSLNSELAKLVQEKNKKYAKTIRKAGCTCNKPDVVFSPNRGIRCRNCNFTLLNLESLKDDLEGI